MRIRILVISGLLLVVLSLAVPFGRNLLGRAKVAEQPADITGVKPIEGSNSQSEDINAGDGQPTFAMPLPGQKSGPDVSASSQDAVKPPVEPVGTSAQSDPRAAKLISEAAALMSSSPGRVIDVRTRLNEALLLPLTAKQQEYVKKQMSSLSETWLFSRSVFPDDPLCGSYKVQPGDHLQTIGNRFKVPYEILKQINNISRPESLQAGQVLKVINGPFHAIVHRSTFTLDLYLQNTFVRSFRVGLGKPGMETPTGLWLVTPAGKMVQPTWTDKVSGRTYKSTDSDYPLGSRWIALQGLEGDAVGRTGFAIHGTKDANTIGTASSQGCVRMFNGEAVLVYNLLAEGQSRVQVLP